MTVHLQRKPGSTLASKAVADRGPVHKRMTAVTTEVTTTVERAA